MSAPEDDRQLPDLIASAPRAELDSVTDAGGTVARFEMAYSALKTSVSFGPPLRQRMGSFIFLGFALALASVVIAARTGSSNSMLYVWIVEGDRNRPIGSLPLAVIVVVSAFATLLRAKMRGVIVHPDGIEARYLLPLGVPRIKRWAWAQIDRVVLDDEAIVLELWDGMYERLPDVAKTRELADMLERLAAGRKMSVTRLPKIAGSESP